MRASGGCSIREPLPPRLDLDGRGHAGDQPNAIGNRIDPNADRHALSEADPSEYGVDIREPLLIGVRIRDVDGPRNAVDLTANDLVWPINLISTGSPSRTEASCVSSK